MHDVATGLLAQVSHEKTSKASVHTLVARDKLVGHAQARKQAATSDPEYGRKRRREENAFDNRERNQSSGEVGVGGVDPFQAPVGLRFDSRHRVQGGEQAILLRGIADQLLDEDGVRLGMDIFPAGR